MSFYIVFSISSLYEIKDEKPFLKWQKRLFHIVISTILPCESGLLPNYQPSFIAKNGLASGVISQLLVCKIQFLPCMNRGYGILFFLE